MMGRGRQGAQSDAGPMFQKLDHDGDGQLSAREFAVGMRSAHAAGDRAALRIAVHSTKSNARDLGALELAELCAQLEQQCKEGDSVDYDAELTTIFVKAGEAIQAFKTINLDDV